MKKIILCPNPNRDRGMEATRRADAILREMGFQTVVCPPLQGPEGRRLRRLQDPAPDGGAEDRRPADHLRRGRHHPAPGQAGGPEQDPGAGHQHGGAGLHRGAGGRRAGGPAEAEGLGLPDGAADDAGRLRPAGGPPDLHEPGSQRRGDPGGPHLPCDPFENLLRRPAPGGHCRGRRHRSHPPPGPRPTRSPPEGRWWSRWPRPWWSVPSAPTICGFRPMCCLRSTR